MSISSPVIYAARKAMVATSAAKYNAIALPSPLSEPVPATIATLSANLVFQFGILFSDLLKHVYLLAFSFRLPGRYG